MSGNKHMAYFRKVMSGGIEVASLLAQVDALPQPVLSRLAPFAAERAS